MPVIFQSKRGRVMRLEEPGASCQAQLYALSVPIEYRTQYSIVTRVTVSQQVNVQFLHTMGAHVYVYVFGDRVGWISLSGLAFTCPCDDSGGPQGPIGAEKMADWYAVNRASKRRTPVALTIGAGTIEGFVTGYTADVVDPSTSLVQWGVTMATLPEDD